MMRLPPFTYLAPVSVADAVKLMADHGPEAMLVAGGTDLYPNMKRRQFEPTVLVGLRGVRDLAGVRQPGAGALAIGAGTTLTAVSRHPEVRARYAALATAAGAVSTPQLRNMGTLGGNVCVDTRCNYYNQSYQWRKAVDFCMKKDGEICLVAPGSPRCWAVSSSDTAPALWSLGASVRLAGPAGERTIPISALYQDDGIQYLTKQPGDIVTEIVLPPADGARSIYLKLRRRGSFDFPVLGVAATLHMDGEVVRQARIVLGAVASLPREALEAARVLVGERLTPELIDRAADAAYRPAKPLDNTDMTHPYRKKMVRVYVARALRRLAGLPDEAEAMTALGQRIKAFRAERALQQRQLAEKAGLTASMLSQIESGRLTPSLPTLGKLAAALGVSIGALFEPAPAGRLLVSRKADYPVVSFDGTTEKWHVLGAGLFQGKIRAVMSTLGPRSRGVKTDKVVIEPGQMKLFYVIEGKVALQYNGDNHVLEAGDSAYLDGGTTHGWENVGSRIAKVLWVILG